MNRVYTVDEIAALKAARLIDNRFKIEMYGIYRRVVLKKGER
jgi:hypothetical protein